MIKYIAKFLPEGDIQGDDILVTADNIGEAFEDLQDKLKESLGWQMRIENLDISFGQVLTADILLADGEVVKIKIEED